MGWSSSSGGGKIFRFFISSSPTLEPTQLPIEWEGGSITGVKQRAREVDCLPPTSVKVKEMWSIHQLPNMSLWCIV
jgi:hypothetical protein